MAVDPTLVTSLLSTGINTAQAIGRGRKAKKLRGDFEQLDSAIPEQDPMQVAQLGEVRRQRQAYQRGSDAITAFSANQARNMGAQTQANITRAGRGNVSDLLRAQGVTDQSISAAGARAAASGNQLLGMEGALVNAMADRAYRRQLSRADRAYAEWGQMKEASNSSAQAALALIPTFSTFSQGTPKGGGVARSPNLQALYAFNPPNAEAPGYPDDNPYDESQNWDGDY